MKHDLKTHPEPFQAIAFGDKTFEFRNDERGFQVDDQLLLREWDPDISQDSFGYTGRSFFVRVTYLLRGPAFGVPEGFVVMSIKPI